MIAKKNQYANTYIGQLHCPPYIVLRKGLLSTTIEDDIEWVIWYPAIPVRV
jgi:hypothetical protein